MPDNQGEELLFQDFGEAVEPEKKDGTGDAGGTGDDDEPNLMPAENEPAVKPEAKDEEPAPVAKEPDDSGEPPEYESDAERLAYEKMAKKRGWVPEDKFRGNKESFRSAREFVENVFDINASLQKGHETQKRINDELLDSMKKLREHDRKLIEAERNKHVEELKEARRQAILDADVEQVEAIDKELEETTTSADGSEGDKELPEFKEWKAKNSWFGTDKKLTALADAIAVENPTLDISAVLKLVDEHITEYREFQNSKNGNQQPEQRRAATVESGSTRTRSAGGKKFTVSDLNEQQKEIARSFVRNGTFKDIQEYIDDLAAMGAIG